MSIISILENGVIQAVQSLYGASVSAEQVTLSPTRKEFTGDYTLVVFPFTRLAGKKPEEIGQDLGTALVASVEEIESFNVIKGFLNLRLANSYWCRFLQEALAEKDYGRFPANGKKVLVEFSSPNTNKPLHLGHVRNILLGWSSSRILAKAGYTVHRVQIVNDRGIAICKSMLAWQWFGEGATPTSTGVKSDHFVGEYYVLFEQKFQEEYREWQTSSAGQSAFEKWQQDDKAVKKAEKALADAENPDLAAYFFKSIYKNTYFNEHSQLGIAAKQMLLDWEAGDPETVTLWKKMNQWVYDGFAVTYDKLGVHFDKLYYESDTYLLGKDIIEQGLEKGVFYRKNDGSVWIDLEDAKLDHKLVLRSDGTSVYMTQDLGTARLRYQDFGMDQMVYVVADEQNYHFQVLFQILKRLGEPYAEGLHHLSYGMVELPEGKMKSREGTVVDADDLIAEVIEEARKNSEERETVASDSAAERETTIRKIGLAALKFHIIKVQPQKWMTFDPRESVDLQGQTGPYIQYSYVRINGITQRAQKEKFDLSSAATYTDLQDLERELLQLAYQFPDLIRQAATDLDPSVIANYCYALAKTYSRFWHDLPVFTAPQEATKAFRLELSKLIGHILKSGLDLLGIEVPERM